MKLSRKFRLVSNFDCLNHNDDLKILTWTIRNVSIDRVFRVRNFCTVVISTKLIYTDIFLNNKICVEILELNDVILILLL